MLISCYMLVLGVLVFFWKQIENLIARKELKYNYPGKTNAT